MKSIYVADVADGLCMAISTIARKTIQIDCGTSNTPEVASSGLERIIRYFGSPEALILSHFHVDHYNGLIYLSNIARHPSLKIKEVYYPRIPDFNRKDDFVLYLLAMNLRVFGSQTGIMEYDFLETVRRISTTTFDQRALCRGDLVNMNGSVIEVLWPPAVITDNLTLSVIRRALESFETALEQDVETKIIYDFVRREGAFKAYLREQDREDEPKPRREGYINSEHKEKPLPQVVKDANKNLKLAANHLSLAFFEDNRLLFLGDTENFEIKQIISDLESKGRQNFYILITPHHGTHWNSSLNQISCIYSVTSNGAKLCSRMKPQVKLISQRSLATWANGDIAIPIYY